MKYNDFIQLTDLEFCKKIAVFEIIEISDKFPLPVAAFSLPNNSTNECLLHQLLEVCELWNHPFLKILGSCSDGLPPESVETFMEEKTASAWCHSEDYIHILKRMRNPLIDNKTEVSMLGLIYLSECKLQHNLSNIEERPRCCPGQNENLILS
jgi:hypothetical protein